MITQDRESEYPCNFVYFTPQRTWRQSRWTSDVLNCTSCLGATARMAPFFGPCTFRHLSEKEDGRNTQQKMLTTWNYHVRVHVHSTASREVKCLVAPLRCVRTDSTKAWPPWQIWLLTEAFCATLAPTYSTRTGLFYLCIQDISCAAAAVNKGSSSYVRP